MRGYSEGECTETLTHTHARAHTPAHTLAHTHLPTRARSHWMSQTHNLDSFLLRKENWIYGLGGCFAVFFLKMSSGWKCDLENVHFILHCCCCCCCCCHTCCCCCCCCCHCCCTSQRLSVTRQLLFYSSTLSKTFQHNLLSIFLLWWSSTNSSQPLIPQKNKKTVFPRMHWLKLELIKNYSLFIISRYRKRL